MLVVGDQAPYEDAAVRLHPLEAREWRDPNVSSDPKLRALRDLTGMKQTFVTLINLS